MDFLFLVVFVLGSCVRSCFVCVRVLVLLRFFFIKGREKVYIFLYLCKYVLGDSRFDFFFSLVLFSTYGKMDVVVDFGDKSI